MSEWDFFCLFAKFSICFDLVSTYAIKEKGEMWRQFCTAKLPGISFTNAKTTAT